jgi:hypothetical protein
MSEEQFFAAMAPYLRAFQREAVIGVLPPGADWGDPRIIAAVKQNMLAMAAGLMAPLPGDLAPVDSSPENPATDDSKQECRACP